MLLQLEEVLSCEEVEHVQDLLAAAATLDGKRTAHGGAAAVKKNLEIDPANEHTQIARRTIVDRLSEHPLFELAVQPAVFSPPILSRYDADMEYGFHLDAAMMRREGLMRADVSVTVFLSAPDSYDGGELVIQTSYGEFRYKGNAGDCVIYPSSTFHRVDRVTRGSRIVGVLWVQSMVRDPARRQILYDLGCTAEYLDIFAKGDPNIDKLRRCYVNLIRAWAEVV